MKTIKIAILIILLAGSILIAEEEKMRLAILDLNPEKVDASTARMVSDLLRTELFNTGIFRVLERGEMESILKEQEFQISGCTETECAVDIGKLLSARKILVGSIGKLGKKFIINARIVDVEKGEMEFADSAKTESESTLDIAVKELAQKISGRITGKRKESAIFKEEKEIKKEESKDIKSQHFLIGVKVPVSIMIKKSSPVIPTDGPAAGIGIGFYTELIPIPYIAFETGIYVRTFSVGGLISGEVTYSEYQIPYFGKIRIPVNERFAISIGAGGSYYNQFSGTVHQTVADAKPIALPDRDLKSGTNLIIKIGFHARANGSTFNFDFGYEQADRSLKISQKDLFITIGMGFSLF